jgi:hypothetical protein
MRASRKLTSTSKAYFLSPILYLLQREREKHMRILHRSKPRCKAFQGFFLACFWTHLPTQKIPSLVEGGFCESQVDLLFKNFSCFTLVKVCCSHRPPLILGLLNSQAIALKLTSYNLQIRGEPGEQALPYLYIISLPLWMSRHKNSTLLPRPDLQFWVPYG